MDIFLYIDITIAYNENFNFETYTNDKYNASLWILGNPTTTPAFSQEGSSVFIAPGASNPNNDYHSILLKPACQQEALFLGQMKILQNTL